MLNVYLKHNKTTLIYMYMYLYILFMLSNVCDHRLTLNYLLGFAVVPPESPTKFKVNSGVIIHVEKG